MGLNAIDIIVLLLIAGTAIGGALRGFVTEALSMVAWIGIVVMVKFFHAPLALVLIVLGMSFHFAPGDIGQRVALRLRLLPAPALGALAAVAIMIVDAMRFEGVAPFIYYQF